jgi:glycosyltransferase involved in cell wall biosynthesis
MQSNNKINVLLLVDHLHIGGAESVVASLCHALNKQLLHVRVCCIKTKGVIAEELIGSGIEVDVLPQKKTTKSSYTSFLSLRKFVRENHIDIVHSHTTQSLIDGSLCKLMSRGTGHIHTFHFGNYPNYPRKYLILEKLFSRVPDRLVAVGNEQKKTILQTFRFQEKRVDTVWNGVTLKWPRSTSSTIEKHRRNGSPIIGTVCTLIEQKGLPYLIEVAAALKQKGVEATFLIAGEGHLHQELETKARELGLDKQVIFLGWVQNASQAIVPYIDIFFLPSLWEAMSVVVLEAMAAERPVVVTDVGENKHVVDNGENGFVVPSKSVDAMVSALEKLITSKTLRENMGAKAGTRAREFYSVEHMARAYERLYLEVCRRKGRIL